MPDSRGSLRVLLIACIVGLTTALAAGVSFAQTAEPAIRAFSIPTIEKLGFAMAEQAQEASTADDILTAEKRNPDQDGVRGWVFDPSPGTNRMRFIREGEHGLEAAYDVIFTKTASPKFLVPARRELDAGERAQFSARQLAATNIERPCSDVYNTLAVKDPEGDRWLVWALATTPEPGSVAIGGHYRFTISGDGKTILRRDALSLSCIVTVKPELRPGGPPQSPATVTHLVSDTPIETHVFVNLLYNMRLIVDIPDHGLWQVDHGHVQKLSTVAQP